MGRFISWIISLTLAGLLVGAIAVAFLFYYFGAGLPDYKTLSTYEPPIVSRLYSKDGKVFAEYAHENRIYVPLEVIPQHVRDAFMSAEDKNFYHHFGVDIPSIIAAALTNVKRMGSSKRPVGASTITQQVAKNFLLTDISHMVSIERKIKEAILSLRIEKAYSKDYIFELYLNEVYLGNRSYGIAAAALNYFNKSLSELTIAEAAFCATLPKAPSRYDPIKNPEMTYARRDWVIDRMYDDGVITKEQMQEAKAERIVLKRRNLSAVIKGNYFSEEVRRELIKNFGEKSVYEDGYVVRTTLDPHLQNIAEETLRDGLVYYDRDHGWRGPVKQLALSDADMKVVEGEPHWVSKLATVARPAGAGEWVLCVVLKVEKDAVQIGFMDGKTSYIPLEELKWARRWISDTSKGPLIIHPNQVLHLGDVVLVTEAYVDQKSKKDEKDEAKPEGEEGAPDDLPSSKKPVEKLPRKMCRGTPAFKLCQIPAVSGALVVLDPATGRVLAMQGGYDFEISQFNRATQAMRQTGSAFKPFVYLAAFEKGLNPTTMLNDAPFSIAMGYGLGIWAPHNWDDKFKGPITLRRSFELSRNVSGIRMIHERVGMKNVCDVARRFNIDPHMPVQLAGTLGASETTVLRLTAAYAMLANGGKLITPSFMDQVQDRRGKTVLVNHYYECKGCEVPDPNQLPQLVDRRPQVTDPISAYQMTSLLRGAVERGLAKTMMSIHHQVVVKSGTTNEFRDAWMVGYSPNLVVGVYVGFDTPRTLGIKHFGTKVAGPIFKRFMERALDGTPVIPFKIPNGVKMVRVNAFSGATAQPGDPDAIYEALKPDEEVREGGEDSEWDGEHEYAGEDGAEEPAQGPLTGPDGSTQDNPSGSEDEGMTQGPLPAPDAQSSSSSGGDSSSETGGLY